jgi:hypothetical protein
MSGGLKLHAGSTGIGLSLATLSQSSEATAGARDGDSTPGGLAVPGRSRASTRARFHRSEIEAFNDLIAARCEG